MFVCSCVKDAKSIKTREEEEGKRITQQKTIANQSDMKTMIFEMLK